MPPLGKDVDDSLELHSPSPVSKIGSTSNKKSGGLTFKPRKCVRRSRSVPRLPTLDETTELISFEEDDTVSSGYLSDSGSNKHKIRGVGRSLKTVQQLCTDAKELAHTGEEAAALKVYENAITIAGTEISRINVKIRASRSQHFATRDSIQGRLKEDLRKVGVLIGKLRTKMAVLYERAGDFERAIACCREALEIYKHQPVVKEDLEKDKVEDLMELATTMINKLESAGKALVARDPLLAQIEQLRREISRTTDCGLKLELYEGIKSVADEVRNLEVGALGKSHSQIADTLQMLSTIALEQSKHNDAVEYLVQAIAISKDCLGIKHPRTGQYYLRLARIHLSRDEEVQALGCFSQATDFLRHSRRFSRVLGSTFNDVAVIYMRRRAFDDAEANLIEALYYYERAMQLPAESESYDSKQVGQSSDSLQVLRNLGDCYMKKKEFLKATEAFVRLLKLQRDGRKMYDKVNDMSLGIFGVDKVLVSLIDDDSTADTLMLLGRAFAAAEMHPEALSYFREAADLLNRIGIAHELSLDLSHLDEDQCRARRHHLANTLYCIAEESCSLGDYDEAIRSYGESMRLRRNACKAFDKHELMSATVHCTLCFVGLGTVHMKKQQSAAAYKVFSDTVAYCNRNMLGRHPVMSLLYQRMKEIEAGTEAEYASIQEIESRALEEIASDDYQLELRKVRLAVLSASQSDTTEQVSAIARLLRSFGSVHARLGDKESAQRAYADATKLFKNSGAYEKISI
jgi:tetratricopeptide (TPR) repeat protein